MRIQSRHLALTALFTLMTSSALLAQETPAEPSADTPATERVQRQDRVRMHQPADGVATRERVVTRARAQNRIRPDGATAARTEARQRARGNASGARSVTRQRARVHRPGR